MRAPGPRRLCWTCALALSACHAIFPFGTREGAGDGEPDRSVGDGPRTSDRTGGSDGPPELGSWARSFGDSADTVAGDVGNAVAVDPAGNVTLVGTFDGEVNFGCGKLTSAGGNDIAVAVYSPAGECRKSWRLGGGGADQGYSVAVDNASNVYVAGWFEGQVDFGGGKLGGAGATDALIASYTAQGIHRWSKSCGASSGDLAKGIAVDPLTQQVVYAGAIVSPTVNLGAGAITCGAQISTFAASYDLAGNHRWSKCATGSGRDWAEAVAIDSAGRTVIVGHIDGTVNLGGPDMNASLPGGFFIASFDSAGKLVWSKHYPGAGGSFLSAYSVALDGAGQAYVTGMFEQSVSLGGVALQAVGSADIFVASYDASGVHRWSKRFGSPQWDSGTGVTADSAGRVFLTAWASGPLDFGGPVLGSAGSYDAVVAGLTSTGAHRWSKRFGGPQNDVGRGVAARGSRLYATGSFGGSVAFEATTLTAQGGVDGYVARLPP